MNNQEEFLQFLDPDLCTLTESIEAYGLRTLSLEYKFQDMVEDKQLFKLGNKIWIQGDTNLTDCLYVINTEVQQDIYRENSFTLEAEEVLVELNYATIFSQTELTNTVFHTITTNGKQEVIVDWNALNYWFGDYFNMGIIQQCISEYASRISITGTVNRMELLRSIEEETGNVFVTRYEKDQINNTIHRYLDFLNPINVSKNWQFHMEYDFYNVENTSVCYDSNGNVVSEDKDWEVTRFNNTAFDPESVTPSTDTDDEDDYDVEISETYDSESNVIYDFERSPDYTPIRNLNPDHCVMRIVNEDYELLNSNGRKWKTGDTALQWDCSTVGLDDTDYPSYLISLQKVDDELSITVNEKSFVVMGYGGRPSAYLPEIKTLDYGDYIASDYEIQYTNIPDDSYFEIYDSSNNLVLFRTRLNTEIGHVHEEVLDFGDNLENIMFNVDETETYNAVSPILQPNGENSNGNDLSRSDINTIIEAWSNLSIEKGDIVPMVVEKMGITGTGNIKCVQRTGIATGDNNKSAEQILNIYDLHSNYWTRPLRPNDNEEGDNKSYEYFRGVAYWRAPYTKNSGELYVLTDKTQNIEYTDIYTRPDTRNERTGISSPKTGNTETSDENVYAIYNQVCQYLKEHETPKVDIEVDVANLIGHEFNNYDIHDKIYLKLANTRELITARVTKTTKEAHDIAKNTIEISNYRNVNTIKTIPHETFIHATNAQFDYPNNQNLTIRLENSIVDSDHDQYPGNKLITFTLYKLENGSSTLTGNVYTKLTDANGYATINMKYDPGDYEMHIAFYGDEEYLESDITVTVNVGGTLPVPVETTTSTKSKTTKKSKTKTKTKTVKSYWTKCGLSPDKKQIVSIAQPSSADAGRYNYHSLYKTVFKNYCPNCKRWGTLRFDGGKANKCITSSTYGVPWKPSVPEHEITCIKCDSDYCGVTGLEKSHSHTSRLKNVKKPVKSSKSEFQQLVKGKLLHSTKEVKVTSKKTVDTKTRKIRSAGISSYVKKQALAIVKNKTGAAAMKAIVGWIDNPRNFKYDKYYNFRDSPETCLKRGYANCCDGTRTFFQLCDAAGLCEYYDFYYVHVSCPKFGHVYGIVESKKTKKWRYVDVSSDRHTCWGYVIQACKDTPATRGPKYPKLPF